MEQTSSYRGFVFTNVIFQLFSMDFPSASVLAYISAFSYILHLFCSFSFLSDCHDLLLALSFKYFLWQDIAYVPHLPGDGRGWRGGGGHFFIFSSCLKNLVFFQGTVSCLNIVWFNRPSVRLLYIF